MGTTPKNKAIDAEYLLNQLKNLDKDILETKYVQEKDVKDTYTATDENPISGKGVSVVVNTLQQDINGKSNIGHKHTKSEITDFPTSMTPTAHNQASNTINAMTDYSKATSVSAITPTDTLNVAIGKLEKALDSKGTSSFSGSYNDLTDKPTIPSVGNGTITVNQNGTKVGEFSTNQSTNTAINLTNTTYDVATSSKLGLVKSGTDITVDSSGNVSINDDSHNHIISNVDGLQIALDGKAASSHTHDDRYYTESEIDTKLNSKLNTSLKGSANGLAELDSNGKVLSSQLPSFVDDIVEGYLSGGKFYKESAHTTEITGETGKIYIDLTTNKTYRWSGSAFVVVSETLALGETSSTAYRGDRGKIAYDHSQSTHARTDATKVEKSSTNGNIKINGTETTVYTHPGGTNPHGTTKSDVGLGNVGNFKAVSTVANQGLTDTEKSNARSNINAQAAGSYASASHTHDDRYYTETEMNTKLNGKANSSHTHGNGDITSLDASKITSGTISIDRLPQGALERLTIVADDTARFKLTSSTIQKGDTVKVTSTGKMYYVVDETKLSTEAGYEVYAAGTAASVPWSGVTGKPSTYPPSSHTHSKSQITDFPSSLPANGGNSATVNGHTVNSDVPSGAKFTDTWRPIGTTADTACAGNDSRLSNARPASDVYAWAKASSKPSYSWSEITSKPSTFTPASHTHNYAGSNTPGGAANSAKMITGFHSATDSQGWGVQTGQFVAGMSDGDGGDLAFRKNCPSSGRVSMVVDGYYYQNEGQYRCLDTSDSSSFAPSSHNHNYAGSSSAGGSANSAVKLDTATAGSATQPVYFSGGKPVACSYTLGKSVPSNAVFTDTNTKVTNTLNKNAKAYVTGTTSASTNTGTQIFDTGVYLGTGTGQLNLEGSNSANYTAGSSVLNVKMPAENNSICGVNIAPYENDNSNYLTGLNINCGKSTSPGMQGISVNCSANNYQSTVRINRSGTNSYALQVPNGKSYIATIYSNSSTITTSDREKKTDIQSISDKYEELFFKLQPRLFKFKDGTSGRIHIGAIAQEVEEALKDVGLSDTEFAGFVRQEKEYVVNEETGEITQEEGYDYYLRYEEFVMLLCHMLQKLYAEKEEQDNKISDLESRIAALESKLG